MSRTRFRRASPPPHRPPPARAPFGISDHAVDRAREYFMGGLPWPRARAELRILSERAVRVGKTPRGEDVYRTPGEPFAYVVRTDARGSRLAVTVIRAEDIGGDGEGGAAA